MGRPRKTFEQRCDEFWRRVDRGWMGSDPCWIWTGPRRKNGYGIYNFGGHGNAHQFAWMSKHGWGSLRPGVVIRHRCDNRPCCNPSHLIPGSQADNIRDRDERGRGRWVRGESNGSSKLTADKVRDIRRLYRADVAMVDIATAYDVTPNSIRKIIDGITWKHVAD